MLLVASVLLAPSPQSLRGVEARKRRAVAPATKTTGIPQWELLAALKDLNKTYSFFTVFAERYYTAARYKLITLDGPSTILIPSNIGNQFMKKKWEAYTPQQRLRIMKNLIIKGLFSKDRLLSTVPMWQFRTMNMGLKLVKMNKFALRQCYFKAPGGTSYGPLNQANMSRTKNIQVHGISLVPIPANVW
ncbi:hypothetical protein CLOM_g3580 [Closterium sp. NIES-68]|nr:hypothetical protein CLOM_g644 [Closterium sp. NIES-68]GJP44191.1 hypothetical protein CLOM_g3580 [Closterium sp. NIES-68]GJP60492.1 hypothetical protein CLOP_g17707 [Closterium sp. NIES-67]GJP65641.1 hypothetical protein CLOP_g22509 [Closterium sp. NIES-67]GJP65648.1 hypothetical protein CLOP_g22516 [Closterium sp. NIES-67]